MLLHRVRLTVSAHEPDLVGPYRPISVAAGNLRNIRAGVEKLASLRDRKIEHTDGAIASHLPVFVMNTPSHRADVALLR